VAFVEVFDLDRAAFVDGADSMSARQYSTAARTIALVP